MYIYMYIYIHNEIEHIPHPFAALNGENQRESYPLNTAKEQHSTRVSA